MPKPRLLLTRPHPGAAQFLDRLSPALRDGAVISPLIEIAPTGVGVDLAPFAGVIFTSANGVAHAPKGDGRPAFCVGPQTTAAAAKAGWQAQMAGLDAQALIATLSGQASCTERVIALSISPAAAQALEALPLYAHDVAAEPTGEAMAEAVEKLFRCTTLP